MAATTVLAAGAAGAAEPARPLRVLTLNLLHGGAASGWFGDGQALEQRLEIVAEELRALAPDVIALQEASVTWGRGNVAERLARRLGFHHVFASATDRLFATAWLSRLAVAIVNFAEGPAVLSRFPIVASEMEPLPRCRAFTDARAVLHARLDTPWGPLPVFSTHTSRDPCQARHVAAFTRARRAALPGVLMGDFNATEDSVSIAALTADAGFVDAFRVVNPGVPGFTVWQPVREPARLVRRRVDYVFLVPGTATRGRVLASRVVLDTPHRLRDGGVLWPSDHHGVLAEIQVAGE